MKQYLRCSRSGTYSFLMALPLVFGYEICLAVTRTDMRISAETWIKRILLSTWGHWGFFIGLIFVAILIFLKEREEDYPFCPSYFAIMIGESLCWVPVFAVSVGYLTFRSLELGMLPGMPNFSAAAAASGSEAVQQSEIWTRIGIALGAGVYEEFVFRVLLVGGLVWLGRKIFPEERMAVNFSAMILGAVVFSLVHYLGPLGDRFTLGSFIFRFFAGLLLNLLFLTRGFGIAAWTHAFYDIMVLLH